MKLKSEVDQFLKDFIFKLDFWGLRIMTGRTNPKNEETLLKLELKHIHIKEVLKQLTPEDYSQGPFPDKLYQRTDMWVFGKMVRGKEIYIKIQLGLPETQTVCISFHFPEHTMKYPLKK